MKIKVASILILALGLSAANAGSWWSGFCERNLVMEDPYQFQELSVDQLITVYFRNLNQGFQSKALINEMKRRLRDRSLHPDDREVLSKTLANEGGT